MMKKSEVNHIIINISIGFPRPEVPAMVIGSMILLLNYVILKTLCSLLLSWNCSIKAKETNSLILFNSGINVPFSWGCLSFHVGPPLHAVHEVVVLEACPLCSCCWSEGAAPQPCHPCWIFRIRWKKRKTPPNSTAAQRKHQILPQPQATSLWNTSIKCSQSALMQQPIY